jgi:hypothetical protein
LLGKGIQGVGTPPGHDHSRTIRVQPPRYRLAQPAVAGCADDQRRPVPIAHAPIHTHAAHRYKRKQS